ncbi:MAG: diguanylate cyclase, partial [Frankiales bacterium]|nr:diguanylate cyclase [Frankiales bacterium]
MTLRLRLTLAFLLVMIVPLLVAALVVGHGVPRTLDRSAENRLAASRAGATALLQQTCANTRLAAEVLGREASTDARPSGLRASTVNGAVQDVVRRGLASYAAVTDGHGRPLGQAGVPPQPGSGQGSLGSCSQGQPADREAPVIADVVEVTGPSGRLLGRAAVARTLDGRWLRSLGAATDARVSLLLGHRVVATTEQPDVAPALAAVPSWSAPGSQRVAGRLAVAAPVGPNRDLRLVLSLARPGVGTLSSLLVAVLVVGLLLAAVLGWLLARVTTRPLAELSTAAERLAAGDLDTRLDATGHDEVGRLAGAFNEMTEELRSYVGELETSRDQLRHNLARLGDTLSSTHDLGRILTVILDTAIGSVRATAGAAYVQQGAREDLVLRAGRGLERRSAAPRIPVGEGVTGGVAAQGEAVRGRVGEGLELSPLEPTATELISVPMRTNSGVLGVLNLYDREDGKPFDAGDLDTIRTFAGQAAVAIDNVFLHQEAQRLSVTDGLTGLGNYRFFQQTLAREVERASRFGRELALLMLDLDLFKNVNDVHGHQVGDEVLLELANRVRHEVREVDIVARYGGEEFVVIL